MALLRRGRKEHLPPLSEEEVYARCHGGRGEEVRIVKVEPRRPRYELDTSGENLRVAFEERLETREPAEGAPESGEATSGES